MKEENTKFRTKLMISEVFLNYFINLFLKKIHKKEK